MQLYNDVVKDALYYQCLSMPHAAGSDAPQCRLSKPGMPLCCYTANPVHLSLPRQMQLTTPLSAMIRALSLQGNWSQGSDTCRGAAAFLHDLFACDKLLLHTQNLAISPTTTGVPVAP